MRDGQSITLRRDKNLVPDILTLHGPNLCALLRERLSFTATHEKSKANMTAVNDRIQGSITALITPFKGGDIDAEALKRFVEWQLGQGTHGLVPVGTTGE